MVIPATPDDAAPLPAWLRSLTLFLQDKTLGETEMTFAARAQNVPVLDLDPQDSAPLSEQVEAMLDDLPAALSQATKDRLHLTSGADLSRLAATLSQLQDAAAMPRRVEPEAS